MITIWFRLGTNNTVLHDPNVCIVTFAHNLLLRLVFLYHTTPVFFCQIHLQIRQFTANIPSRHLYAFGGELSGDYLSYWVHPSVTNDHYLWSLNKVFFMDVVTAYAADWPHVMSYFASKYWAMFYSAMCRPVRAGEECCWVPEHKPVPTGRPQVSTSHTIGMSTIRLQGIPQRQRCLHYAWCRLVSIPSMLQHPWYPLRTWTRGSHLGDVCQTPLNDREWIP